MSVLGKTHTVALFGVGKMGEAYAQVLQDLGCELFVVGRSEQGVQTFSSTTGVNAIAGGLKNWNAQGKTVDFAIVAVNGEELASLTLDLIDSGVKNILLEKPGGLDSAQIENVSVKASEKGANVLLAYNRRFYASTQSAIDTIEKEGGITSFHFDFTERTKVIESQKLNPDILKYWVLANSSHVIDLAFYLGGGPEELTAVTDGALDWHDSAVFAGVGKSTKGVPFSYRADWLSAGRWSVEVFTHESRLILSPMEKLQRQENGSFEIKFVEIDDSMDTKYKPGIYKQTEAFLKKEWDNFVDIHNQVENCKVYNCIANYS